PNKRHGQTVRQMFYQIINCGESASGIAMPNEVSDHTCAGFRTVARWSAWAPCGIWCFWRSSIRTMCAAAVPALVFGPERTREGSALENGLEAKSGQRLLTKLVGVALAALCAGDQPPGYYLLHDFRLALVVERLPRLVEGGGQD